MLNHKLLKLAIDVLKELPQGAVYSTTRKPPKGAKVFTTTGGTEYWMPSQQDKKPTPQNQKNTNEAIAKLVQEKVKRGDTGEGREVELSKDELSYVLSTGSYALVSGGRNSNIKEEADLDEQDEKFVQRHEELKSELVNSGYAHTEITGHYGGEEKSFLVMVHDQDESEMKELGKKYNQDSVIVANQGKQKMFFTTGENEGSYFSGSGWEQTQDAETDYTLFKTSDGTLIKFSLNFDFDNMNTDEGESAQIEKAIIEQFLHIIHRKPPDQNLKKITRVLV